MLKENGIKYFFMFHWAQLIFRKCSSHWLCGVYCELLRKQVKVIVIVEMSIIVKIYLSATSGIENSQTYRSNETVGSLIILLRNFIAFRI